MKKGLFVLAALTILGGVTSGGGVLLSTSNTNEVVAAAESDATVQNVGKIVQNGHTGEILYCDSVNTVTAITKADWNYFLNSVSVDGYTKGTITFNGVDLTSQIKLELIGSGVGFSIGREYFQANKPTQDSVVTIEGTFADPEGDGTIAIEKSVIGFASERWGVRSLEGVSELGKMGTSQHAAGGIAYLAPIDKSNLPDYILSNNISWWPSSGQGYTTGYVKKSGTKLADTLSFMQSYNWFYSTTKDPLFDIGRENGSLTETGVKDSAVADGTTLTFGGLFRENGNADRYIYVSETTLVYDASISNWSYPSKDVGYLTPNSSCSSGTLYMSSDKTPDYIPPVAGWSNHNNQAGTILVNGEASTLKMAYVNKDAGFLVWKGSENLDYEKGTEITISGDFYYNFDGVNQMVSVKKTTFVLEDNWVDVNVKAVDSFTKNYLHMEDYTEDLGYCADEEHHYYADAKAAYKLLTDDAKDCFLNRDMYKAALARLETWALKNGEEFADGDFKAVQSAFNPSHVIKGDSNSTGVAIALGTLLLALTFSTAFLFKKKKNKSL